MTQLPRINALLGCEPSQVAEEALHGLVAGRVAEDQDLEFKQVLYGNSDADKRELAADVAALANTVGGLLIVGIRDADGVAAELTPVPLGEDEVLRMRQVIASAVAPPLDLAVHRVSAPDSDAGYYLIEIPASADAPHAVRTNDALRYPRRDGARKRWLAESEVADAYRNRFTAASQQVARLEEVRREGEAQLPPPGVTADIEGSAEFAWLSIALSPNRPGHMTLNLGCINAARDFVRDAPRIRIFGSAFTETSSVPRAGFRRVVIPLQPDEYGRPHAGLAHLHTDGCGFAAAQVGREPPRRDGAESSGSIRVDDEWLVCEALTILDLLAQHAAETCGASGDAAIEATLVSHLPMNLTHDRGGRGAWTHHPIDSAPIGRHTVNLDEIVAYPRAVVVATRMVVNDLFQGFGQPECPQVTADGGFNLPFFSSGIAGRVQQTAEQNGLDVVQQ